MGNNFTSPNSVVTAPELANLSGWLAREIESIEPPTVRALLALVADSLDSLVRFPTRALLLWDGCGRVVPEGQKTKYHKYPDEVKCAAKTSGVYLDARANGPAIAAFQLAGAERPARHGSSNAWSVLTPTGL